MVKSQFSADKMLPTMKERRKNAPFFHLCYADLCKLRNVTPHPSAKGQAGRNVLDFCGDRVKLDEWAPILEALKYDRSLHFIAFRSKYPAKKALEDIDTEAKARSVVRRPVFFTNFVLRLLMESIASCVGESTGVTCIELEGLPVGQSYMPILCKGISTNTSLQTISLHRSSIGDEGCKLLCVVVRNLPTLIYLDLSNCELGDESAVAIAELLKYQTLQRYSESWKQSLRYREPDIEAMPGLRRIILNNNAQIGDLGVRHLSEVLKEDIWLRAIDLQNCNITSAGALDVLDMLKMNGTLCIVDVRDNKLIDEILVHQIMARLYYNNVNKQGHEYHWTVPESQVVRAPSCQSLRSRPSLMSTKQAAWQPPARNVASASSRPALQRCKSLCLTKKSDSNTKKTGAAVARTFDKQLQEHRGGRAACPSASVSLQRGQPRTQSKSSSAVHVGALEQTRLKLKQVTEQLELETSLRKRAESRHDELNHKVHELESELHKEKAVREGFCVLKQEAYDAILETFDRISIFMEGVKEAKALASLQGQPHSPREHGAEHLNEMKKSHSAHAKSTVKLHQHSKVSKSASGLRPESAAAATAAGSIEKGIGDFVERKGRVQVRTQSRKVLHPPSGPCRARTARPVQPSRSQDRSLQTPLSEQEWSPASKSNQSLLKDVQKPVTTSLSRVQQIFESLVREESDSKRTSGVEPLMSPSHCSSSSNSRVRLSGKRMRGAVVRKHDDVMSLEEDSDISCASKPWSGSSKMSVTSSQSPY